MTTERRRTLIGIDAGIAMGHVGNYIWMPIMIAMLGATESGFWAGFVVCMTYVGRLTATFFYAGFMARANTRTVICLGVLLEATSLLLMGFAGNVILYSLLAFSIGFGSGTLFPGLKNVLMGFPDDERPKAFSTFQMASQLGLIAGALIGGLFLGVRLEVLFTSVFGIFLVFLLAVFLGIPASSRSERKPGEPLPPVIDLAVLRGIEIRGATKYFLLSSVFWFLSLAYLVAIPLHMQRFVPEWAPSVPFWINGLVLLAIQYPAFKFMISHFEPGQVMAVGFGAMALSYLAFGAGQSAAWLIGGCVVVVLGEVLFTPSFDIWVGRKVPEDRLAKAMGAMHFFRSAGNMLGSVTAGVLFDLSVSTGVDGLNWYIVAAVACVGAAICLSESGRKTADEPARSPA